MEKNVVKTIREAFKIAYLNKVLKESSEDLASKLNPGELSEAEKIYPSWISGRKNDLRWGKIDDKIGNYLVEKAVEEYKQTKDKKIHDAVSNYFYPVNENSKIFRVIKKGSKSSLAISSNLRNRYGNSWEEYFPEVLYNAWAQSLGDVNKFDEAVNEYTTDSPNGIGGLLINKLTLEALRLSSKSSAVSRGGRKKVSKKDIQDLKDEYKDYFMKYNSYPDEFYMRLEDLLKDSGQRLSSIEDLGTRDEEGRKEISIAGGVDSEAEYEALKSESNLNKLSTTFEEAKNFISQSEDLKNPLIKLILVNYLNGIKPFQTVAENPDIINPIVARKAETKGGDMAAALKQVKNETNAYPNLYFKTGGKFYALLSDMGIKNGLPNNWLELLQQSDRFIEIANFIANQKRTKGDDTEGDWQEPKQDDDLVFEKFLNENMEKIVKEVQRRLNGTEYSKQSKKK